jgi:eukaryotic-like serine/threonine-protein kinase
MRFTQVLQGLVLLAVGSVVSLAQDAAMFRGNPRHTGVYEAAGVSKFNDVKWKFHTGGMVIGSPAVVGGLVYVGGTDGNLYALDAETGTAKWKFDAKSRLTASATVSGGWFISGHTMGISMRWRLRPEH